MTVGLGSNFSHANHCYKAMYVLCQMSLMLLEQAYG